MCLLIPEVSRFSMYVFWCTKLSLTSGNKSKEKAVFQNEPLTVYIDWNWPFNFGVFIYSFVKWRK